MADVETRFVKLKFLQRTGSGTVDLANRSQGGQSGNQGGGCGGNNQGGQSGSVSSGGGQGGGQQGQTAGQLSNNKFDKLIVEIEKILGLRSMQEGSGGDSGGGSQQTREAVRSNRYVTQVPGRNILAIRATKEEFDLIDQIIVRADRPPFQVVVKGLVYTANQDRLRDIGVQTTITGGTADGRTTGGLFGDTLGVGTLFDFSTVIGTFDFNVQATAFQQNGVITVKGRPFATVIDGLCTTLDVGRQLPIVIDSSLGGQGDIVFVNAANNLAVTPYVIDDDNGDPVAVTLELRLTANDIDSSVTARGVPAISARSIQTQLLLNENTTAILGGFTVDSDSYTKQKTPGLGDIPIIGELFKRRIRDTRVNRLYFAISVDVLPYPEAIRPVDVPGATTDPPSITPEQKKRADAAEPKQVKGP
jgi:type II secretory pathway component GspD/PulD (secretin)